MRKRFLGLVPLLIVISLLGSSGKTFSAKAETPSEEVGNGETVVLDLIDKNVEYGYMVNSVYESSENSHWSGSASKRSVISFDSITELSSINYVVLDITYYKNPWDKWFNNQSKDSFKILSSDSWIVTSAIDGSLIARGEAIGEISNFDSSAMRSATDNFYNRKYYVVMPVNYSIYEVWISIYATDKNGNVIDPQEGMDETTISISNTQNTRLWWLNDYRLKSISLSIYGSENGFVFVRVGIWDSSQQKLSSVAKTYTLSADNNLLVFDDEFTLDTSQCLVISYTSDITSYSGIIVYEADEAPYEFNIVDEDGNYTPITTDPDIDGLWAYLMQLINSLKDNAISIMLILFGLVLIIQFKPFKSLFDFLRQRRVDKRFRKIEKEIKRRGRN